MPANRNKAWHAGWRAIARRFALLFLPSSVLVGAIVAAIYGVQFRAARKMLLAEQENQVALQSEMIIGELRLVVSDLLILGESHELAELLAGAAPALDALTRRFSVLAERKAIYDQVRYLDQDGNEVVRVDLRGGRAVAVPQERLQSKADRYYFSATIRLDRGEVFVSPFDLNVEEGRIEEPLKPTIRFAMPVFDGQGARRGIVILNYLGEGLLGRFRRRAVNVVGQVMLLNPAGYWLRGPAPADEWAFMYPGREERRFGTAFPAAWRAMQRASASQITTAHGLFTYQTVHPVTTAGGRGGVSPQRGRGDYYWTVVAHVGPALLAAQSRQLWIGFMQTLLLLVAVLGIGSGVVAKFLADHATTRAALERARQRALQAERLAAIGEAMTGLAHESRNALQRGRACLEMLAKRVGDRPDVLDLIERLQRAQQDLHRLYETVREYAAPMVLERDTCDLRQIVQRSWADLVALHGDRDATLRQHDESVDAHCDVDPFAIGQAVRNVLENTLRNESPGPVRVDITWADDVLGDSTAVRLSIEDDGPGLSPEQARHIFDPFYTTRARGTGLGMAITRRIIEAHGGQIAVGRATGSGTSIVIHLPRGLS